MIKGSKGLGKRRGSNTKENEKSSEKDKRKTKVTESEETDNFNEDEEEEDDEDDDYSRDEDYKIDSDDDIDEDYESGCLNYDRFRRHLLKSNPNMEKIEKTVHHVYNRYKDSESKIPDITSDLKKINSSKGVSNAMAALIQE